MQTLRMMRSIFFMLVIIFSCTAKAHHAIHQANTIHHTLHSILPNSSSLKWVDAKNLPKGAKVAILTGNPMKKGFYVARLKLPANYVVPAHSHVANEYNTVISGEYFVGVGDSMKKHKTIAFPAGSFLTFHKGETHYGYTKEKTMLEISGVGPWGTVFKKPDRKLSI